MIDGNVRDRITGLRRIRAGDLRPNPRNWRQHSTGQRQLLERAIDSIGIVDAVIARQTDDGALELVDGHLRADLDADREIPVLVVDLSEEEASAALATLDPLAEMAQVDMRAYEGLIDHLQSGFPNAGDLWADMADWAGIDNSVYSQAETGAHHSDNISDSSNADPVENPVSDAESIRTWVLHLPRQEYDEIVALTRMLGEKWGIENGGDIVAKALRMAWQIETD